MAADGVADGLLLSALDPVEVARTLAAADEVALRAHRSTRAAEMAVERVRYQAQHAERAFSQVEPENRLMAGPIANLAGGVYASMGAESYEVCVESRLHAWAEEPSGRRVRWGAISRP